MFSKVFSGALFFLSPLTLAQSLKQESIKSWPVQWWWCSQRRTQRVYGASFSLSSRMRKTYASWGFRLWLLDDPCKYIYKKEWILPIDAWTKCNLIFSLSWLKQFEWLTFSLAIEYVSYLQSQVWVPLALPEIVGWLSKWIQISLKICRISGSAPIKHASFALIFHMIISNSHGKAQLSIRRLKDSGLYHRESWRQEEKAHFSLLFQCLLGS